MSLMFVFLPGKSLNLRKDGRLANMSLIFVFVRMRKGE